MTNNVMRNFINKIAEAITEDRIISACYCLAIIGMLFVCLILLAD